MLRLEGHGVATAYVALTTGSTITEVERCKDAFAWLHRNELGPSTTSAPDIVYLLGQVDLAARVKTTDFRSVLDVHYPRADSEADAVNWVFSVPYAGFTKDPATLHGSTFRFFLHIRLRRHIYAYQGMEERLVAKLQELLHLQQLPAQILGGLGWSDLIVDGTFTAGTFNNLIAFLNQLNGLNVGDHSETFPALQRLVTIVGYGDEPPRFPNIGLVTFVRATPGHHGELGEQLRKHGDDALSIIDGKADFVVSSRNLESTWLAGVRSDLKPRRLAEKIETHLWYRSPFERTTTASAELTLAVGEEGLHFRECNCERQQFDTITEVARLSDRLLSPDLRHSTENMLFLLRATIRDKSVCCDLNDAVAACHAGLAMILQAMDEKAREIPGDTIAAKHNEMRGLLDRLDEWRRCTELLLRQRTITTDIPDPANRSHPYHGGVQKFLYLADQLINSFARRVRPGKSPLFAVVCDAVDNVVSLPNGIVRVPTTKIFTLPLMVPDLWHEVGVRLFLQEYAQQVHEYAPVRERGDFMTNVAEHYADLIVYLYGFRGNFTKFTTSLLHRWREAYRDSSFATYAHTVGQLLTRAYLVYELHVMRTAIAGGDLPRLRRFFTPAETVTTLTRELRDLMASLLTKAEWDVILTDADWSLVSLNAVTSDFSRVQRSLYLPLLHETVHVPSTDLSPFERGEIVQFDATDDLNDYFGELAFRIQTGIISEARFLVVGSLARSAEIEFHRRQARAEVVKHPC